MSTRRGSDAPGHPRIDEEGTVDRYLAGRLPPEEEARFEEHLFECAQCLEQVEAGEELRRGLHAVAAENAARVRATRKLGVLGLVAWLRSRRPLEIVGLASLALAFVLLPTVLLWQRAEPRVASGFTEPLGDFRVVSLGGVRAGEDVPEIRVDSGRQGILFSLELPAVTASRYRVTLQTAEGETLWTGDDLEPNLYDTLLVAVPPSYLAPGSYRMTIEAKTEEGAEPEGEVAFRVAKDEKD